jgi:pantoate--beta-alanine ligase
MRTLGTLAEAAAFRKSAPSPVVLVPTMGALHEGHAMLVQAARQRAGEHGTVVASVFVNPTQFGPNEDFSRYPRTLDADLEICRTHGADAVFAPTAEEMYPPGDSTFVDETQLSRGLCGAVRPGHFRGVCTVVAKLFLITRPDAAIFGEKDYQQLAVIRRMTRDLFLGIEIIGHATVRESDGLAMSSRNRYLSTEERARATGFAAALRSAQTTNETSAQKIIAVTSEAILRATGCAPEYLAIVDPETLAPRETARPGDRVLLAARLGATRLIDNIAL